MLAVLDESMRVYPPVPGGLPRYTAKGGGMIAGEFIPENVCIFFYPTIHLFHLLYFSEKKFN